tara:strand:- start:1572 stop:2579 length:1008 start_codon:yes stop_codon:yes gene_type:complete
MAYIGKKPEDTFRGLASKASFTGDGSTTAFDLSENALDGGTNDIQVFVNNVRQEPGSGKSYTLGLDGSSRVRRITFAVAPAASDVIYVISPGRSSNEFNTVSDNSITTAKIQANAVTVAKLASTLDISSNTVTLPTGQTLTSPKIATALADTSGNELLKVTATGSAVNELTLANAATSGNPTISATGGDTNIGISILPKGSGKITLDNLILPAADGTADQILTTNGSGQLSFVDNSGGTSWQAIKTSDFTAVGGEGYFVNTTSGAVTVTLPTSPSLGDEVSVVDYAGTADTNNITINRNSHKIQGDASNLTISTERAGFTLVYVDATQGWLLKDK